MSLCNFTLFAPYLHQANSYFLCFITETQLQNSLKVLKGKKSCIQYISARTEFTIPITILKACLLKKKKWNACSRNLASTYPGEGKNNYSIIPVLKNDIMYISLISKGNMWWWSLKHVSKTVLLKKKQGEGWRGGAKTLL